MRIRTIVVDDEPLARDLIRELLVGDEEIEIVAECANGHEALRAIRKHRPDLAFLDVQMPGLSGFNVLARLEPSRLPHVIFVTAYDRYAMRAFDVKALDYLLKPIDKERFYESVARMKKTIRNLGLAELADRMSDLAASYAELQQSFDELRGNGLSYPREILVRDGNARRSVAASEILWIEAANQYVRLHTAEGSHMLSRSLGNMQGRLDPNRFCRIHRSTIVNISFVRDVRAEGNGTHAVVLTNGERLRLSRRRGAALTELLRAR